VRDLKNFIYFCGVILSNVPKHKEAVSVMGFFSSLIFQSKTEEEQQQKADQKNFDILKYDGIRAQRMGKTEYAVQCFTEALKIQKDPETMKYLISAYYTLNRHDRVLEVLNDMIATGEESADTLLMRASLHFLMEKYAEAAADCMRVIALEPDNYLAYYQLAKSECALGESTRAIEHLNQVTGIKDDFVEAYLLRAEIYYSMEKATNALADIEKLIELTPDDETAYLLRGCIHELLGDGDAAFADYQQALELNPFNEKAYLLAGRLMMTREKYDEAIALFDEAIEHNEKFAKAYEARALAKHQTGDHQGALTDETIAGELNPEEKEKPDENHNFDDLYKGNII
jgi:tetratricopeptide (TPR) repeat protein